MIVAALLASVGTSAIGAAAAVDDSSVSTIGELQAASNGCTGTSADPTTITLAADIADPAGQVDVNCHAVLSLAGHDLTVRNLVVSSNQALTIADTGTGGTLTADAGETSDVAGIQNTGATLTVASGTVAATGGLHAAGIGGGSSGDGGITTINGGTVIATTVDAGGSGGSSAVGPGDGGSSFGSLSVNGGVLRLPSSILRVPDSAGVEITIGPGGVIDGSGGPGATYASITGAGQIDNHGRLLLPTEKVTAGGVTVTGRHYAISFDTQGGSGAPDPVTVFADTLDNGARSLPTNPTKSGATFAGWNLAADGSGARVTATSALRGSSLEGTPVPITAYAQWRPAPAITAIAPSSGPLSGGTEVVITGTDFTGATRVSFGLAGPATSFTVDSATQITAVSPPSATIGARAITVITAGGVSAYVDAGRFTYTAPVPEVTEIAPSSGPLSGGTEVVITGTSFTGATKVTFGMAGPATSFTVDSATQITAVSPASATTGARAITVTTPGGISAYVDAGRFTYTAPVPAITEIAPSSGPLSGGTEVVITGTGFTGATKVTFGMAGPAPSFTVDSATQITAISPSSSTTGVRALWVTTPGGASAIVDAGRFTYTAPVPAITEIAPSSGPLSGGTEVVITGTGFSGATKVTFGLAGPATSFTVDSATRITAVSPSSSTTGARAITVTTAGGVSAYVDADLFTYTAPAPEITAIAPSSGPIEGGTEVVITGTGFSGATKVTFGLAGPATSFTVDSATQITATSPASATTGARAITVTAVGGVSAYVDAGQFTYTAPAPEITAIAPSSGPIEGGTNVVITGTGFSGATKVTFGLAGPATSFTVDSATQITAISPSSATIGARAITVAAVGGVSAYVDAGQFTYTAPAPEITAIAPSSGPIEGGTEVVITGTGFTGASKVTFGMAGPATSFTVDSATQITAVSPASATTGARAITVTAAGGVSAYVDASRFTYTAPAPEITEIAPSSGPLSGGTEVVITGTSFTGATKVTFGMAGPATKFTVDSSTQITATSPGSATAGVRRIWVTTAGGASALVDASRFTYTAPAPEITEIAPASGPIEGGTRVVITGTAFTGATKVTFGMAGPATKFTVDSSTQITATSPASATAGVRRIWVTTAGGASALVDASRFTYTAPAPEITEIAPSSGPLSGGTRVVITGTGFTGATKVTFGVAGPATSFTVSSATRIIAFSPASATTGVRRIWVTTAGGASAIVDAGRFTYAPVPAITAIAPSSGPLSGGTQVVITGTGFTGATKVTFGAAGAATSFTVDSATRITATSPPSATTGARGIWVTTAGGASAIVDLGRFTYVAPPAIAGIAPASGPTTGGTSLVITGTGFTGATKVTFGDAGPATSFTVDSATQITAISPAAPDIGVRHVSVSTAGGPNAEVDADVFTYTAAITKVVPSAGPMSGGTEVVITGTGFTGATAVTFGDAGPATSFTVDSATRITAISPAALDNGARHIRVSTADGEIAAVNAVADRFTYTDPPDACGNLLVKDDGSTWTCSFVDDFDGQSLDTTKWGVQESAASGFRTGETCYVNSPQNIDVRDGELRLTVRRETQDLACDGTLGLFSTPYTGGMVGTRGKFSQTYGRFEVRAKYPTVTVPGLHGGFWAMPRDHTYGVWPLSGELDIAEWWSNAPTQVLPTLHYSGDSLDDSGWNCRVSTPTSFHTYTMEWYPDVIKFFIDGEMCFERSWTPTGLVAPAPFDKPFSMILGMGVGTLTGPNKVSADTPLPATYTIDYAKVWR